MEKAVHCMIIFFKIKKEKSFSMPSGRRKETKAWKLVAPNHVIKTKAGKTVPALKLDLLSSN